MLAGTLVAFFTVSVLKYGTPSDPSPLLIVFGAVFGVAHCALDVAEVGNQI